MFRAFVDDISASPIARAGVLGLAYFAGAELGHLFSLKTQEHNFVTFWPPAGFLLAALVLTRIRLWPALLLAACGANLASDMLHGKSVPVSLGFCVANCGEACLGAWMLRRFVGLPFTLARMKDVLGLAGFAALISTMFSATIGAGLVTEPFSAAYWSTWQVWWIADAVGVLVVAPVVLTWTAEHATFFKDIRPWRVVEAVVLFVGLILVAEGVYGELLPAPLNAPIFVLPFLLWAGLRFGPSCSAAAILVVALIGVWNISQGRGPFMVLTPVPSQQLLRAQTTLFAISLSVLALAATVAERQRAEQLRIKLIGTLEHALNEIKSLRGLIPVCAWCKKMRDDQGYWQRLEDYLRAHTEAKFTHGICPDCMDKQVAASRSVEADSTER